MVHPTFAGIALRLAQACPGHPRIPPIETIKSWMAGTSPAKTVNAWG